MRAAKLDLSKDDDGSETMSDDIYMNKSGFKCVKVQLAKTEGRDPQEYERAKLLSQTDGVHDPAKMKSELAKLRVRIPEYAETA